MIPHPLVFSFNTEPGLTDSEILTLWQNTQNAQAALDRFLAGEFTEQEMTDLLALYEIDCDQTREQLEQNAQFLGLTEI